MEAYHRNPDDPPFPPLINLPQNPATGRLALDLRAELDIIDGIRYEIEDEVRTCVTAKFVKYRGRRREWHNKVIAAMSGLESNGEGEDAKWLATMLAVDPNFYDNNHYRMTMSTGTGNLIFKIVGTDEQRQAVAHGPVQPETVGRPATSSPRALDEPAPFEVPRTLFYGHISLANAAQQRLWLCWSRTGALFCITCPCEWMITTTTYIHTALPEYNLVPRHFHTDPFANDHALRHFEAIHHESFPHSPEQMLEKYGQRVEHDTHLDRFAVAAHNSSVQAWYTDAVSNWQSLREYRAPRIRSHQLQVQHVNACTKERQIDQATASNTFVFPWPEVKAEQQEGPHEWAVFCTYPDCPSPAFREHPLGGQALDHFARHGLHLKEDYEVLALFGFPVIAEPKSQLDAFRAKGRDYLRMSTKQLIGFCQSFELPTENRSRADLIADLSGDSEKPRARSHPPKPYKQRARERAVQRVMRTSTDKARRKCEVNGIPASNLTRAEMMQKLRELMEQSWLEEDAC